MKKLVIYGTGLIAEVADFYFTQDTDYEVEAFLNASDFIEGDSFQSRPLVPFENAQQRYPPAEYDIFIALGYTMTNQVRQARYTEAKQKGYTCATYVSPNATYYGTPVGDNCFILENNVIQPFTKIGNNVTLWSGNHIGHHSTIKDHCFISSHVVISGNVVISENCFFGVNSTLRDNIEIGRFTVVSSGAIVMRSCEERSLVLPAQSTYRVVDKDVI
jgi:sugar O-acyltransferase (sialic acid O-acetyltransferase NeuD family)